MLVESGDRLQKWSRDGALAWESETEVVGLLEVAAVGEDVFAVGVDQQARTWFTRLGPDGANLATVVDLEQDGWPGGGVFGLVPWTDGRLALFVQGTADQIGIAGVVVLRPDGSAVETRELVIADVQFGEPGPFSSWGLSAPDIGAGLDPGQFIIGGAFSHVADGVGFSGPFLQSRDTFETVRWEVPPSATATANAFFDDIEVGPDGTVVAREWSGGLHAYDGDGQRRWSESKRVEGSDAAVLPDGDVVQHYLDYRPLDDGTFTNFTATRRFGPQGELVWRMEREGSRPGSLLVTHDGDLVGCYVDDATEEARLYAMVP